MESQAPSPAPERWTRLPLELRQMIIVQATKNVLYNRLQTTKTFSFIERRIKSDLMRLVRAFGARECLQPFRGFEAHIWSLYRVQALVVRELGIELPGVRVWRTVKVVRVVVGKVERIVVGQTCWTAVVHH